MKFEVGQDALGMWAWMIMDGQGRLVASDDNYWSADLAVEDALAQMKRRAGDPIQPTLRRIGEGSVPALQAR